MDADEIASSFTEVFENCFPYYLAIGMTYEQFWCDPPELAKSFRKANEIRKRRLNEEMWLNGMYTADALMATVGNMFSKSKYNYPSEPKPITRIEWEEKQERERIAKMERMKAKFMAQALNINAQMEVKNDTR